MHIHRYERFWIQSMAVVLAAFIAAVGYAAYGHGMMGPTDSGQIHPASLASTPPFDQPGLYEIAPGRYRAVIIASTWQFEPGELEVPAGSTVEFVLSSRDVIHGFRVDETTLNAMVIPGQVTQVTYTFDRPGPYTLLCHEYCGIGHHLMAGEINVVTAGGSTPVQ